MLGEVGGKKTTKPHGCQREGEVDVCVGASLFGISHELGIDIDVKYKILTGFTHIGRSPQFSMCAAKWKDVGQCWLILATYRFVAPPRMHAHTQSSSN